MTLISTGGSLYPYKVEYHTVICESNDHLTITMEAIVQIILQTKKHISPNGRIVESLRTLLYHDVLFGH